MNRELFAVTTFCSVHNIEQSFIASLHEEGLISITIENDNEFIEEDQLHDLELYTRWHREMGINPAGIDVVRHLVHKLRNAQNELNSLKDRLRYYEPGED
ncbi:MAG: chaperone modulator CbpM [Chitinophagaceae bacterium]|nr:chaperone modulator CbpM [Chitinophagaceae bacterium]